MRRRLALVLAPLVLTSLLLAACGDGDGDDDASSSTTTEATTTTGGDEPGDDTTTTGTTEDDGSTGTTDGSATTEGSGTTEAGGNEGGHPFCTAFRDLNEAFSGSPDSTLEDLQEGAATFAEESAAIVDTAPAELTDQMQVLADFFAELRDTVADATTKDEAEAAAQELNSPEINEAGNAITTWISENCAAA